MDNRKLHGHQHRQIPTTSQQEILVPLPFIIQLQKYSIRFWATTNSTNAIRKNKGGITYNRKASTNSQQYWHSIWKDKHWKFGAKITWKSEAVSAPSDVYMNIWRSKYCFCTLYRERHFFSASILENSTSYMLQILIWFSKDGSTIIVLPKSVWLMLACDTALLQIVLKRLSILRVFSNKYK